MSSASKWEAEDRDYTPYKRVAMLLGPITALANVVPFIGNIVGAGTGCVSLGIGGVFALLTGGTAPAVAPAPGRVNRGLAEPLVGRMAPEHGDLADEPLAAICTCGTSWKSMPVGPQRSPTAIPIRWSPSVAAPCTRPRRRKSRIGWSSESLPECPYQRHKSK